MRFSVIVPIYNKAPYVEKAIRSIFDQTFQDFDLIVVDDGSTDGSDKIVEKLISENLKPKASLIRQPNQGVSAARNDGVAASSGEYICFLDADDWWEPTFLEEMDAMISAIPNAGIYGTSYFIVKHGKKRLAPINPIFIKDPYTIHHAPYTIGTINYLQTYAQTLCMPLWTGAVCLSRAIFDEFGGFRKHLKLGEDFDLWIRVVLKYKVAFLDAPLSNYNQDVDVTYRGTHHLHDPKVHMLWNLDYLSEIEKTNSDYKQLIDNLRTYSIYPYFLSEKYHETALQELSKIDWSKQSVKWRRLYGKPIWYLRVREIIRTEGSKVKSKILH